MKKLISHIKARTLVLEKELKRKNRFRVSIFGSARIQPGDSTYEMVHDLAEKIGIKGYDLITGGGPGLMEAANFGHTEGDKKNTSESIGLIIKLPWENKGNDYLEYKHTYKHFSKRLDTFLALSDVMVVTKGGIGSLLELFYMWQHMQVFMVEYKPIILIGKMWEDLIDWMKKATLPENLVSPKDFDFIYIAHNNNEAMEMINKFHDLYKKEKALRKIDCKGSKCVIPPKTLTKPASIPTKEEVAKAVKKGDTKKSVKKVALKLANKRLKKMGLKAKARK